MTYQRPYSTKHPIKINLWIVLIFISVTISTAVITGWKLGIREVQTTAKTELIIGNSILYMPEGKSVSMRIGIENPQYFLAERISEDFYNKTVELTRRSK